MLQPDTRNLPEEPARPGTLGCWLYPLRGCSVQIEGAKPGLGPSPVFPALVLRLYSVYSFATVFAPFKPEFTPGPTPAFCSRRETQALRECAGPRRDPAAVARRISSESCRRLYTGEVAA